MTTKTPILLEVEIRDLPPMRAIYRYCLFRTNRRDLDKAIRQAFQKSREQVMEYILDPDILLHVGLPEIEDREPVGNNCCIEFPIPIDDNAVKVLPADVMPS